MIEAELIVEDRALASVVDEWDALAVLNAAPTSAPAWMLAWWRHVAPGSAELRVIAVRERGALIGVFPFYADLVRERTGRHYRLLAGDLSSSVTPLARPDRVWDVAAAAGALLRADDLRPDLIEFTPIPAFSPWSDALRETWPGPIRPLAYRLAVVPAPTVSFQEDSFGEWLAARSSRFRANARRCRRRFLEAGGSYRLATPETVAADIHTILELHRGRWSENDTPSHWLVHGDRIERLLQEAAGALLQQERFRLVTLELRGEPIAAALVIAAGGDSDGINTGWDDRFKQYAPGTLAMLHLIEDGFERGERRQHFGHGRVDYKSAWMNGHDAVATDVLVPVGPRLAPTLVRVAPDVVLRRARESGKRLLGPEQLERVRAAVSKRLRARQL